MGVGGRDEGEGGVKGGEGGRVVSGEMLEIKVRWLIDSIGVEYWGRKGSRSGRGEGGRGEGGFFLSGTGTTEI